MKELSKRSNYNKISITLGVLLGLVILSSCQSNADEEKEQLILKFDNTYDAKATLRYLNGYGLVEDTQLLSTTTSTTLEYQVSVSKGDKGIWATVFLENDLAVYDSEDNTLFKYTVVGLSDKKETVKLKHRKHKNSTVTFFKRYFLKKGIDVKVLRSDEMRVKLSAAPVKNEILESGELWEMIEIHVIFVPSDNNQTTIYLFVNSKFAPGVGARPPNYYQFKSMENEYDSQVDEYSEKILTSLIDSLNN